MILLLQVLMWIALVLWFVVGAHCFLADPSGIRTHAIDLPPPKSPRYTIQFRSAVGNWEAATAEQDNFLHYLEQHGINVTVRYRFTDIMNGMSIHLNQPVGNFHANGVDDKTTKEPLLFLKETLGSCPYVRRYWSGRRYKRPRVERPVSGKLSGIGTTTMVDPGQPNLQAAHKLTGVDRVRQDGVDGRSIKVGMIDTGVDYTHPSLGGCFGDGCLVAYGYDLVGDNYGVDSSPKPDLDPMDKCDGHGTHVAGIIAANDTLKSFQGVAPGVTLGAWRVFGCHGDTDDDIILAAAEMAAKAGMDIINLSLGGAVSAWQEDPLSVALSNIVKRGTVVIVAQGNEGRDGIARTPSPATGTHVMAVASVDNTVTTSSMFSVQYGDTHLEPFEYIAWTGKSFVPDAPPIPLTILRTPQNALANASVLDTSTACNPIAQDLTGQVVLVKRGVCDFGQKAMQVQNAKGVGVIVYSDPGDDAVEIDMDFYPRVHIPVASTAGLTAEKLLSLADADKASLVVSFSLHPTPLSTGGTVSTFSTWGPDPELHLKPDITGVGGHIYSTFPVELGSYAMLSGTSMATPYVAGCVALYMQATGKRSPKAVFGALQNQASPVHVSLPTLGEQLESPIKQGPGLVQIYDAIYSTTLVEPFKISLNDTAHFVNRTIITIHNQSNDTKTYQISHRSAISLSGYNFSQSAVPVEQPDYISANATVIINKQQVTVPAHHRAFVKVAFKQPDKPKEAEHVIFGGYIEVTEVGQHNFTQHVPYFGTLGNQTDLPLLDRKQGFPYIGSRSGEPIPPTIDQASNTTMQSYHFRQGDILSLFYRLGSPTPQIKLELLNAMRTVVGALPFAGDHYLSRNDNSVDDYCYTYNWRGRIMDSDNLLVQYVSKGIHMIRISALKIFGDPSREDDWEVWESPEFNVL